MLYKVNVLIRVMAVASAAKMVLLFDSLLDRWRQVASPFWKWRSIIAAAPNLSLALNS